MQVRRKAHNLLVCLCLLGIFFTSGSVLDALVRCVSTSSNHNAIELAHAIVPCADDSGTSELMLVTLASVIPDCEDVPLGLSIEAVSSQQRGVDEIPLLQPVALLTHAFLIDALPDRRPSRSASATAANAVAPVLRSVVLLI